jgi:hypothetical protein
MLDLLRSGPDVSQVDRPPVGVVPQGLGGEVEIHRACKRIRDHERRGGQVVHLHVGVDPALEVAIARVHRDHGKIVRTNSGTDLVDDRPRVADTGSAAVADQVEPELLQVLDEAGTLVVVHDHFRPRR